MIITEKFEAALQRRDYRILLKEGIISLFDKKLAATCALHYYSPEECAMKATPWKAAIPLEKNQKIRTQAVHELWLDDKTLSDLNPDQADDRFPDVEIYGQSLITLCAVMLADPCEDIRMLAAKTFLHNFQLSGFEGIKYAIKEDIVRLIAIDPSGLFESVEANYNEILQIVKIGPLTSMS